MKLLALTALCFAAVGASAAPKAAFYGDTRTVTALAFAPSGNLVAATPGGMVSFTPEGRALAFGWQGLLSGRGPDDLWSDGSVVWGAFGSKIARWDGIRFIAEPAAPLRLAMPISREGGQFRIPEKPSWPALPDPAFQPAPENQGTHVSAVVGTSSVVVAAWYGDGLWKGDGKSWTRLKGADNPEFKKIRALALHGDNLALATYSGDIWWRRQGRWRRLAQGNGPGGSVYHIAAFRSRIYSSTFEDGLAVFERGRWQRVPDAQLTSTHPRDLVVFQNRLYLRHTTGEIDRWDGRKWAKNVFPWLPRGAASCLAVGEGRLLVGQFGGWSEYDGRKWSHFLKIDGLDRSVATALATRGPEVWMGTQDRGVGVYDRDAKTVRFFDMRQGLGDDWVRRITFGKDGRATLGLFLFGAYTQTADSFVRLTPGIEGEVTGLATAPDGTPLVASREGLWAIRSNTAEPLAIQGQVAVEIQALLARPDGLWLGLPNGMLFIPWADLSLKKPRP